MLQMESYIPIVVDPGGASTQEGCRNGSEVPRSVFLWLINGNTSLDKGIETDMLLLVRTL